MHDRLGIKLTEGVQRRFSLSGATLATISPRFLSIVCLKTSAPLSREDDGKQSMSSRSLIIGVGYRVSVCLQVGISI